MQPRILTIVCTTLIITIAHSIMPMAYLKNLKSYTSRIFGTHTVRKPAPRPQPASNSSPWYQRLYQSWWRKTPKEIMQQEKTAYQISPQPIVQPLKIVTTPPPLAAVTEEAAIATIADQAMAEITEDHEKNNLPLSKKSIMVCTPPGINSALLAEFKSIEAIQTFFKEKYDALDLVYKDLMGMDDDLGNGTSNEEPGSVNI